MAQIPSITARRLDSLQNQPALPLVADMLLLVAVTVVKWDRRRRSRTALARLTPWQLKDIGVTPWDASEEARKAFWQV